MKVLFYTIVLVFLIGSFTILPVGFAYNDPPDEIPRWIKHVAGYWYDEKIPDETFLSSIHWLVNHEIIIVTTTDNESDSSTIIPSWVKNTAGWWANDQIDNQTFVNAIQYLVDIGLIPAEQNKYTNTGY